MNAEINYQKQMEEVIRQLEGRKPTLLLHSCCGPCSSAVLERLVPYFQVSLFWYNPNIWPREELDKRFQHQMKILESMGREDRVRVLQGPWDHDGWKSAVAGLEGEPEGGARCTECFRMRLSLTAQTARYYGFEWYCTTLSVSPYKDALRLNRLGEQYGQETHVRFLPSDFKKKEGYKRSIELCRKYDIYRQDYCGCEFSLLPEKRQELEKKEEAERMLSEAGS